MNRENPDRQAPSDPRPAPASKTCPTNREEDDDEQRSNDRQRHEQPHDPRPVRAPQGPIDQQPKDGLKDQKRGEEGQQPAEGAGGLVAFLRQITSPMVVTPPWTGSGDR